MANFRSFHFVPAHKDKYFSKIETLDSDQIVFDLEDGVPFEEKEKARIKLVGFLANRSLHNIWIRINPIDSTDNLKDLKVIEKIGNIGIIIPKFILGKNKCSQLIDFRKIFLLEDIASIYASFIESDIPQNTVGFGLGLEDMLANIPKVNSELLPLIQYIKQRFICLAKSFNKIAIDGVFTDYKNTAELEKECEESSSLGFDGKFSIYPNQIPVINTSFSIKAETVAWAKSICKLADEKGLSGYQKIDNLLITPPKLIKARAIMDRLNQSTRKVKL